MALTDKFQITISNDTGVDRSWSATVIKARTAEVLTVAQPTNGAGVTIPWLDNNNAGVVSANIVSSTDADPVVLTCTAGELAAAGIVTGDYCMVAGHLTNVDANGSWLVSVAGDAATLVGSCGNGNGAGTAGKIVKLEKSATLRSVLAAVMRAILNNPGL